MQYQAITATLLNVLIAVKQAKGITNHFITTIGITGTLSSLQIVTLEELGAAFLDLANRIVVVTMFYEEIEMRAPPVLCAYNVSLRRNISCAKMTKENKMSTFEKCSENEHEARKNWAKNYGK